MYEATYYARLPVVIKGTTGRSRFIGHMAYKPDKPLITVVFNEEMRVIDLVETCQNSTDVTHPLTGQRRTLPLDNKQVFSVDDLH